MSIIKSAKVYATEKHKGQLRKNGMEYINHPLMVGDLVMKYKESHNLEQLIAVSYLHDVLEDTYATYYDLVKNFGHNVAGLVMELTSNKDIQKDLGKPKYLAYKLKSMTNWALVIKLCDRLDNISDLDILSKSFKDRYIKETTFIVNYIEKNRKLTNTHKKIIKDIKKIL